MKNNLLTLVKFVSCLALTSHAFAEESGKPPKSKYSSIKTTEKVIALTFDDGPLQANTPRLLDTLKKHDAKGTFFVVGNMVKWHKDTLKRIVDEGHEVANHTTDHPDISKLSDQALITNLKQLNQVIETVTGAKPRFFRPPFGAFREEQVDLMYQNLGLSTALWSVDPQDWKSPGVSVIVSRIVNGAEPGAIVVTHDIMGQTIDAIPQVLTQLKAKGYRFVTLSELITYEQKEGFHFYEVVSKGAADAMTMVDAEGNNVYLGSTALISPADVKSIGLKGDAMIELSFKDSAKDRIGKATQSLVGKKMAITYDNKVISAPIVNEKFSTGATITGNFTKEWAKDVIAKLQKAL